MSAERYEGMSEKDLAWAVMHDPWEKPAGRIGVMKSDVVGTLRFVDGWGVTWTSPYIKMNDGRAGVSPYPMLALNFPDYPREDAATYLLGIEDARVVARSMLHHCDAAERTMSKIVRGELRRNQERVEATMATAAAHCAHEGCSKGRHFFDDHGVGFCKRHAEERGIRPHGRVI